MIVYSTRIIKFVHEIKCAIQDILSREMRLKVTGRRFFDRGHKFSYPISVVIYNNKSMLGYFDPHFYELGFHECLMQSSKEQLHNIIRHELAHYMTFITYGNSVQPHASEFKAFCQSIGWGEEVYKATCCLDGGENTSEMEKSSIFRKVQKLMALSNSSNTHEAESAMIKSQQLLLQHNIESEYIESADDDKMFLKRIMQQKKENAKMRSIARILETFFVTCVYRRAEGFICLEILGNAVNIEIAEYVADILHHKLDTLWDQAQEQHADLKGMVAKNSFFQGIAKGYCTKINFLKREYNSDTAQALQVIEKKLSDAKAHAYPRLSSTKSNGNYCPESSALGEQMGKQLNINPAIRTSKNSEVLLTHCEA